MRWDNDALEELARIVVPPVMAHLARFDAEKRARMKHMTCVTAEVVRETQAGYAKLLGREAMEIIGKMANGEPVDLPDEFFVDMTDALYSIQVCPAKFGACTRQKRTMMLTALRAVSARLEELNITGIMLDKAGLPIMSHHTFRVTIAGCPNCCLSPYFSDFGILCVYRPAVQPAGCVGCGACVRVCSEQAITCVDDIAVIDHAACCMCGGCVEACPHGAVYTASTGYKVVVGGTGSRHPAIAATLAEHTDVAGMLRILQDCLEQFAAFNAGGGEVSFHDFMGRHYVPGRAAR
jgi:dissimilatory sulfite reductase (desulfoviridin) alpha/beta subunit